MGSAASKAPKRAFPKAQTLQRAEHPTSQSKAGQAGSPSVGAQADSQQLSGVHSHTLASSQPGSNAL